MIVHTTPFTRIALRIWSGAIIWAIHFTVIYGFAALACARGYADLKVLGMSLVTSGVLGATILALVAALAIARRALRSGVESFETWMTASVAGLASLAIVWEGLAAWFILPSCG